MVVGKIGASRIDLLGSSGSSRTLGDSLNVQSTQGTTKTGRANEDAATVSLSKDVVTAKTSSAPGVSNYLAVRENAANAITSLRAEQQSLAEKGATLAESEELATLQSRFGEIEEEISRISSEATYKGQNVLQGAVFGENDASDGSKTKVFAVASLAPLTADPGLSLATPELADAADESLTTLVGLASSAAESSSRAQEVASSSAASSSEASSEEASRLSVEDAQKRARSIADQVTQAASASFSAEDSTLSLIDSLDQTA